MEETLKERTAKERTLEERTAKERTLEERTAKEQKISFREACGRAEIEAFWEQVHIYHKRDVFADVKDAEQLEELEYFLDDARYRSHVDRLHERENDRIMYLFMDKDGVNIGFAMAAIYATEDGKCFLMEFCVYPEYRGGGLGTACGGAFLDWAFDGERGAAYVELNNGGDERRRRFWQRLGFEDNGADEWGNPLMILMPEG